MIIYEQFTTRNILNDSTKSYYYYLHSSRYKINFKEISKGGSTMKTKVRGVRMHMYGGTIGRSQYPKYIDGLKSKMLPRPVVNSRPGNKGYALMKNTKWLYELTQDVSKMCIHHLVLQDTKESRNILSLIKLCLHLIPSCLRICDTFFTQMALIGDLSNEGKMPGHMDKDDYICAVLTLGDNSLIGGSTFYNGIKDKFGKYMVHQTEFQHGRIQIGAFDNIIHGVNDWNSGSRGSINFNFKKNLLQHFIKNGNIYYNPYVLDGYPSKHYVVDLTDTLEARKMDVESNII